MCNAITLGGHELLSRCWGDVGPASQTVDQHYIGTGSVVLIGWDRLPAELMHLHLSSCLPPAEV